MNAVAYTRYSPGPGQKDTSIEAQVREITSFAKIRGYNLLKVYADRSQSGYVSDRAEFQQMIKDSKSSLFDTVLVHKFDRFGRDGDDAAHYERLLKMNGVRLVSVEEQLDERTPEGRLLKRVIQGVNEFYGMNLAREAMKGLKTNALKCLHTGGLPPLGFNVRSDKTYEVNEFEARAVHIIFDMYLQGHGYSSIIRTLNESGHRTKAGRAFGKNSLHEILKNEKYTGTYIFNRSRSKDLRGKRNTHASKKEDDIIRIEGGLPVIIDREQFEKVQKKMTANRHKAASNKAKVDYLFSGILYCGNCGGAMCGDTSRYRGLEYSYYVCNNKKHKLECDAPRVKKDALEATVIEQLNNQIFAPKYIDEICKRIKSNLEEGTDGKRESEFLRKQISSLERKITNAFNAIADGMNSPEFLSRFEDLRKEKQGLTLKLIELEQTPGADESVEEIREAFEKYTNIADLPFMQRKMVIDLLVYKVLLYPAADKEKGWNVRVILTPNNPARQMVELLDIDGGDGGN